MKLESITNQASMYFCGTA